MNTNSVLSNQLQLMIQKAVRSIAAAKLHFEIGAFNRYFVKTRVFPKEFSKLISRLFRERQDGDYQFDLSIEEKDAEKDIQIAEKILKAITDYLVQEGFVQLEKE